MDAVRTPEEFVCPITQRLMNDPVIAVCGHTFERKAITRWWEDHEMCTVDHALLPVSENIESDTVLQRHIESYVSNRPSLAATLREEEDDLDLYVQLLDDYHADVHADRAQWVQRLQTERHREKLAALEETDEEITNIKSKIEEYQAKLAQAQRKRRKLANNTDEEAREGAMGGGIVSSFYCLGEGLVKLSRYPIQHNDTQLPLARWRHLLNMRSCVELFGNIGKAKMKHGNMRFVR